MLNEKKVTFRCKGNPRAALFTPQYEHDLAGMRAHPDYEEVTVDADGNITAVIVQPEALIHRPILSVEPQDKPAPKKVHRKKA